MPTATTVIQSCRTSSTSVKLVKFKQLKLTKIKQLKQPKLFKLIKIKQPKLSKIKQLKLIKIKQPKLTQLELIKLGQMPSLQTNGMLHTPYSSSLMLRSPAIEALVTVPEVLHHRCRVPHHWYQGICSQEPHRCY
jgi:predicted XRE-type DNA-binding protein